MTEISITELLDAMPDPAAVNEHWRRICQDMVTRRAAAEYERGLRDGHLATIAALKRAQHQAVDDLTTYLTRWHLCCRRCRLKGHLNGCQECVSRTRETFGEPMPGEPGSAELVARARASWEPLGLGPGPGWVHLGGPVVHHHACSAACYEYKPGWYTLADAITILEALPGNYIAAIAGLRSQATAPERTAA